MDWKNILSRAAWTFVQAFASVIALSAAFDLTVLKAAALAGASALLSLVKTIAQEQVAK